MVDELGVRRWEIITPGTDFDLGALATGLLRCHGLMWPAPVVAFLPMLEAAAGGVLVTGLGGDEVFGTWGMARTWEQVRQRQLRSTLPPLLGSTLPQRLRRRRAWRGAHPYQTWLTPETSAVYRDTLAAEAVAVAPLWWPDYLREVGSERGLALSTRTYAALGEVLGAGVAAPLLAPTFLAALARRGGRLGLGGRTPAMRAVFSPLLTDAILSRVSKATFGGVFWGPASRQFAEDWDGGGLDPCWVDPSALRDAWRAPTPVYGAALPLQAAWLATQGIIRATG